MLGPSLNAASASARGIYVRDNERLALYRRQASAAFWDESWHRISGDALRHALRPTGRLGIAGGFFADQLPLSGTVLEAGCGTGLWVRRLRHRGYECIGLDFAIPSLVRSKGVCPELPLLGGNVLHLPFADGALAAYLSFGVVEHFESGPGPALREAARILRRGGVACFSVPYVNLLRRSVPTVSKREAISQGLEFYQYYFSEEDFNIELEQAGLRPTDIFRYQNVYTVLKGRVSLLSRIARFLPRQPLWTPIMDLVPGLPRLAAHTLLTVAIRP